MSAPNTVQDAFRWKNDTTGIDTDSGWAETLNTQLGTTTTPALDTNFRPRFVLDNTGTKDETDGYELWYRINGGTWTQVTTTSSFVRSTATIQYADGATTNQLIGSGTYDEGYGDENDGQIASFTLGQGTEAEIEWCIQFRSADFTAGGELVEIRMRFDNGSELDGYTTDISFNMPEGEIQQSHFRIRNIGALQTINQNTDWAANLDTNATLDAAAKYAGVLFGLRFELEEIAATSAPKTITPKIQYRVNAGTWTDLSDDATADNYIDPGVSNTIDNVIVVNKATITDGAATTNILSGSAKTFVAGTGEHDVIAADILLNNEHTEIEWRILIKNRYNTRQQSVGGDEYEFRIVESDNTLLDGTYVIPKITINLPDGYIGGTGIETSGSRSYVALPDGTLYAPIEDGEIGANLVMLKSIDDGKTWLQQDAGIAVNADLESFTMEYDDTNKVIHCVHITGSCEYYQFGTKDHATDADQWIEIGGAGVYNHQLEASIDSLNQSCDIVIRGSTIYAFYADLSSTDQVFYRKKPDLSTTNNWAARVSVDTTGGTTDFSGVAVALGPNSNLIHIFYTDYSNYNVHHRSLNTSDTLGTIHTCDSDLTQDAGERQHGMTNAICWYNGTNEKAMIGYKTETEQDLFTCIVQDDGTPDTPLNASNSVNVLSNPVGINSRQVVATLAHDSYDDTIYLFYAEEATEDLWRATSADGASWSGHTEEVSDSNWHSLRAQVHTEAGNVTVVGYIYDEPYQQDATQKSGFSGSNAYATFFLRADTSDSQSAYIVGGVQASDSKSAYIEGTSGATPVSDSQPAYIKGQAAATDNQPAYIKGQDVAADSQSAYITGGVLASDNQSAYIKGQDTTVDSQPAYIAGGLQASDSQPAYITGIVGATDNQSAFIQGQDATLDSQSAYIAGSVDDSDNQIAFIQGQDTALDSQSAYIAGGVIASDSQAAFVQGQDTTSDSQSAYTAGGVIASDNQLAYLAGEDTAADSQSAYIAGSLDTSDNQIAYIQGILGATDNQSAFIQGSLDISDSQEAYVAGGLQASDNQPAYIQGILGATDNQSAFVQGQDTASDSQSAYVQGSLSISDNQSVYITGGIFSVDNQSAYLEGEDVAIDNLPAYIQGSLAASDNQLAYIKGAQDSDDSKSAYIQGSLDDSDSKFAYIQGSQDDSDSKFAYIQGSQDDSDNKAAYIFGGVISIDSKEAYIQGLLTTSDVQSAYIEGLTFFPFTDDYTDTDDNEWDRGKWAASTL
jgi:hypothetical protein